MALLLTRRGPAGDVAAVMAERLAGELSAAGHRAVVVGTRPAPMPERLLEKRGFAGPLTQIPFLVAALLQGSYDVAEAFTTVDAEAGLLARRLGGPPVIFTPALPPSRANLAERRLSLGLATRAYGESDALLARDEETRAAIERWLALDAEAEPGDLAGRIAVYERCRARSRTR